VLGDSAQSLDYVVYGFTSYEAVVDTHETVFCCNSCLKMSVSGILLLELEVKSNLMCVLRRSPVVGNEQRFHSFGECKSGERAVSSLRINNDRKTADKFGK